MREYPHLNDLYISERLKKRLSGIGKSRITTVTAPMGYGKTTAVRWWERYYAGHISGSVVIKQSVMTDSVSDFWNGLCAALRNYPSLAERLSALGFPDDPRKRALFIEMMRESAALLSEDGAPVYFMIDDVYILKKGTLNDLIMLAAAQLPENMRMILVSRNAVFSDRERMQLGRRLYEITPADLRLSIEELYAYAGKCEIEIDETPAEKLENMSEGWISMIYLHFRRYAQNGEWRFDTQDIFMLMEQVMLESLPERQRRFLVENSAADMFTCAQAEYIWEGDDAAQLLEYVSSRNAFIKMNENGSYRYHHMLLHVARARFEELPERERMRVLKRMGEWYLKQAEYVHAGKFFFRAGDWSGLLEAVRRDRGKSINGEHQEEFVKWSSECPPEKLAQDLDAVLVMMRKLFSFRQIPEMLRLHGILMERLKSDRSLNEEDRNNYRGECELVMSFLKYNDISAMSELHRSACSLMNRVSRSIDPQGTWTFGSPSVAMMFHRTAGMLDHENREMHECMPYYYQIVDYHGNGAEHAMQGETYFMRGDIANADIECHLALNAAKRKEQYSILVDAEFLRLRIAVHRGDSCDISGTFSALREKLKQKKQYILLNTLDICEAWIDAVTGKQAAGRAEEGRSKNSGSTYAWITDEGADQLVMNPCIPMLRTVRQQMLLAEGKYAEAAACSREYIEEAEKSGNLLCAIYMRIQLASALNMLGSADTAEEELARAFDRAAPDMIMMPFAENMKFIKPLLSNMLKKGKYENEIAAVQEMANALAFSISDILRGNCGIAKLLTEQEYKIALLAAERRTNAMIAEEMNLTENTVKTHLKHIFDKVGIAGNVKNKRHLLADMMNSERK